MTLLTGNLPLPESQLRDFSKALPRSLSTSQEQELCRDFSSSLEALIKTAYDPAISISHRGVAINALCSLIGRSASLGIQQPLPEPKWFEALDIVLDRSKGAKSKPLRQLLICLTNNLATFSEGQRQHVTNRVVRTILNILLEQSDHVKVKPALHILTHLLSTEITTVHTLIEHSTALQSRGIAAPNSSRPDHEKFQYLLYVLFEWVRNQEASIAAGQAACALVISSLNNVDYETSSGDSIWALPLRQVLRDNVEELSNYRSHLLPELFKLRVPHYSSFLSMLGLQSIFHSQHAFGSAIVDDEIDTKLLFTCLEIGKEVGIVIDSDQADITRLQVREDAIMIPDVLVANIIENATDSVRLSGLALVISSMSITRPFSPRILRCLKRSLSHLFMETDVYVRGELLVYVQWLVDRIKAVVGPLSRAVEKAKAGRVAQEVKNLQMYKGTTTSRLLQQHQEFVRSFLGFVKTQLHPAAAYQRHITGLRTLIILARSGLDGRISPSQLSKQAQAKEAARWPFHETIFNIGLTRSLQDLLMDPFEDVRSLAATLLMIQADITATSSGSMYPKFLKRAEYMMLKSGRADHADGVSRAHAIVFEAASHLTYSSDDSIPDRISQLESLIGRLENRILLAKDNLALAVGKYPLHGVLASLRLIVDGPSFYGIVHDENFSFHQDFHRRLTAVLEAVWYCVKGVLCNDAPEGYVPEDLEEVSITTKDILSYCWRALKEASSLLRVIISKASVGDDDRFSLHQAQFDALCYLTSTELVKLRHRGAFFNVAQAFAACCSRAKALNRNDLLQKLYSDTLSAIKAKASAITRRSAGLPSLMVGLLAASPNSPLFKQAIDDLLAEANLATEERVVHGDPLPQVHALNCLRSIFTNTILGPYTEPYIAACLSLAGNCLTSDIWAIRNCGLMLFRALIDRLLGSTDSQNWSEISKSAATPQFSYNDFPDLLDMVLSLLAPDSTRLTSAKSALEGVFPALKLIQRLPPPLERRPQVQQLVLRLCRSPHWHVRDMAARSFAGLIPVAKRCGVAKDLIPEFDTEQNFIHGRLLCISHIVKSELQSSERDQFAFYELETALRDASSYLKVENKCPFTKALYLDILHVFSLERLKEGVKDFSSSAHPLQSDIEQVLQEVPTIRKSLGQEVLLQYLWHEGQSKYSGKGGVAATAVHVINYLQILEAFDPQTCLQILEPVVDCATNLPPAGLDIIAEYLSSAAAYDDNRDLHFFGAARLLLVKLYEGVGKHGRVFHETLQPEDMRRTFFNASSLPPSLAENTILLWGPLINEACVKESSRKNLHNELNSLVASLRPFIDEHRSLDLRIAAAKCLANLPNLWQINNTFDFPELHVTKLKFVLLVYDLLNDDDDEIRDLATKAASKILADGGRVGLVQDIVPLLASQRLVSHLLAHYAYFPGLFEEAVGRMTGINQHATAKAAFEAAAADNTALFMVEKQNLFIDPVREAILWSQFLKRIPSIKHYLRASIRNLVEWTEEGLSLLIRKMQEQVDGVLGWTSKPDMFVFGMRVWCAVDVVLTWQRRFGKRSSALSTIMLELGKILSIGTQQDVHEMWLSKLERLLVRELKEGLKKHAAGGNVKALVTVLGDVVG